MKSECIFESLTSELKWIETGVFIRKLNKEVFLVNQSSLSRIELNLIVRKFVKKLFYNFTLCRNLAYQLYVRFWFAIIKSLFGV